MGAVVEKATDAFRTISEVADDLDVPQHVLRFWESRFREMLDRLIRRIASGNSDVQPYSVAPADAKVVEIIERLRRFTPESQL